MASFDVVRVAWLEEIGVKRYKIASRSIRDIDLIEVLTVTKVFACFIGHVEGDTFPQIKTQ